jgi:uncharacterized membrane protein
MEPLIAFLIVLVAAVPIGLIVLAIRQSNQSRRLAELESKLYQLQSLLERQAEKQPRALPTLLTRRETTPISPIATETAASAAPTTVIVGTQPTPEAAPTRTTPPPIRPSVPPVGVPPALGGPPPVLAPEPLPVTPEITEAPAGPKMVDWEKFLGVKLFAWVGGLALFLGIIFFVKYSFEHNLVPPELRVALGFLTGLGLIVGGVLMRRKEYAVTSQTLCATGVVALYGVSFASHGVYHLLGSGAVFLLMSVITVAAFMLAVRLDAQVVAVLGLVGGFLTPPLLSTGQDNPLGLFGYVTLLDLGLLAVAFNRRWHFLILLGAIGTGVMELGWLFKFFKPEKIYIALAILALFNAIEAVSFWVSERLKQSNRDTVIATVIQAAVSFFIVLSVMPDVRSHPGIILTMVLIADLALLAMPLLRNDLFKVQLLAGGITLFALAAWLKMAFRETDLYWALGATLVFAVLHSVYPLVLQRRRNLQLQVAWLNLFPLGAIALMLLVLLQLQEVSLLIWPIIFLLDLLVIGLAFITASLMGALGAVLLTAVFTVAWLFRLPRDIGGGGVVLVAGVFAVLFFASGIWLCQKTAETIDAQSKEASVQRYLPAISAILPFLLLGLMIVRLNVPNPSNIFGLGLVLSVMLLWLGSRTRADELHLAALGAALFLQYFWHDLKFTPEHSAIALTWYLLFYGVFMAYSFVFGRRQRERIWPWVASALSGPLHFYLIYKASIELLPGFGGMGLIPAVLAVPSIFALATVLKRFEASAEQRTRLLALFGGSALFFITMVFPIQFSRQWLTIGWALEGAALLWLYTRVPHRGLPMVGVALLVVAFGRLAVNPNVFSYYARSETRIFNWYLYSYGIVTVCLLVGARLMAAPRNLIFGKNAQPLLYSLATILGFILLNIEIADFFAEGNYLRFEFSGNFARDMTYSIAWALFALGLLVIGVVRDLAPVRYASLGLLGVTLLKLFFHDLSQLGQLYRIGAFIGVAIILIVASWIYQRFLASTAPKKQT